MKHELKIWPCYYNAVLSGAKTFEVRDNSDRGFQAGDIVVLREYNPRISGIEEHKYSGSYTECFIGYVLPISDNKVVFSLLKSMDVLYKESPSPQSGESEGGE